MPGISPSRYPPGRVPGPGEAQGGCAVPLRQRRLSNKEKAERAAAALQASYDVSVQQAKDKQSQLEGLLSLWQK